MSRPLFKRAVNAPTGEGFATAGFAMGFQKTRPGGREAKAVGQQPFALAGIVGFESPPRPPALFDHPTRYGPAYGSGQTGVTVNHTPGLGFRGSNPRAGTTSHEIRTQRECRSACAQGRHVESRRNVGLHAFSVGRIPWRVGAGKGEERVGVGLLPYFPSALWPVKKGMSPFLGDLTTSS